MWEVLYDVEGTHRYDRQESQTIHPEGLHGVPVDVEQVEGSTQKHRRTYWYQVIHVEHPTGHREVEGGDEQMFWCVQDLGGIQVPLQ